MDNTIEKTENTVSEGIIDTTLETAVLPDTEEAVLKAPEKSKRKMIIITSIVAGIIALAAAAFAILYTAIPKFTLKGDSDLSIEVFTPYADSGADAKLLFFDISDKISTDLSNVNTDKLGEYTVTYSVSLFGKNHTSTRAIAVVDTTPPEITLEPTDPENVSHMKFYVESGYTATDGYDGDLTDSVSVEISEAEDLAVLTYSVADSSGNVGTAERQVIIKDTTPPVLTLNGEAEVSVNESEYTDPGAAASDDLDGDITASVTVTTDYTAATVGEFTFTYTVSDAAGNTVEAVRKLTVTDDTAPVITLNGGSTEHIIAGKAFADPGAVAYDSFDGDVTVEITGAVDTALPGEYSLTYTASDSSGNIATAVRTVTVLSPGQPVEGAAVNGQGIVSDSTIYLTYDDGPSWNITPRILDTLLANDVKATFFIVGYSEGDKPIIARAIAEGHTIAIHGTSHDYGLIYSSTTAFVNNITSLQQRLVDDFGYYTDIIRFPGGSSNTVSAAYQRGIMSALCPLVEELGFTYFDWNVSSGDASGVYASGDQICHSVCSGLYHGRDNVVLMHDSSPKGTTADALQGIIDYGKANGFTFAALSSYTAPVHHGVNN